MSLSCPKAVVEGMFSGAGAGARYVESERPELNTVLGGT
jgi:hypothetical protein